MADEVEDTQQDFLQITDEQRKELIDREDTDPAVLVERVYQLWWRWSDFHLYIVSPVIPPVSPPLTILPEEVIEGGELEYVYPIADHGFKLSTSRGEDMYSAGLSMCKLYYTIEKMIHILVDRLKSSGISSDTEVQVAFGGFELAQRKGFESIINLNYNVVVTNFDPGAWGEMYLQAVKRLADKGYGYPPESPRENYRHLHTSSPGAKR